MERIELFFQVPVVQTFGMTEAVADHDQSLASRHQKSRLYGPKLWPDDFYKGPKGGGLSPGETGEILVRGENVVASYEGNKEATAQLFRDDWFHMGDSSFLDADDYLFSRAGSRSRSIAGAKQLFRKKSTMSSPRTRRSNRPRPSA